MPSISTRRYVPLLPRPVILDGVASASSSAGTALLSRARPIASHADAATGAPAALARKRPVASHADVAVDSSAPRLNRSRPIASHGDAATGGTLTTIRRSRPIASHADASAGVTADMTRTLGGKFLDAKGTAATGLTATVRRTVPIAGVAPASASCKGVGQLNTTRFVTAKASTSDYAATAVTVSYIGAGFKVSRPITGKGTAAAHLTTDVDVIIPTDPEGFRVFRPVFARLNTASEAKVGMQVFGVGPGFRVARAARGHTDAAAGGTARLDAGLKDFAANSNVAAAFAVGNIQRTQRYISAGPAAASASGTRIIRLAGQAGTAAVAAHATNLLRLTSGLRGNANSAAGATGSINVDSPVPFAGTGPQATGATGALRESKRYVAVASAAAGLTAALRSTRPVGAKGSAAADASAPILRRLRPVAGTAPASVSCRGVGQLNVARRVVGVGPTADDSSATMDKQGQKSFEGSANTAAHMTAAVRSTRPIAALASASAAVTGLARRAIPIAATPVTASTAITTGLSVARKHTSISPVVSFSGATLVRSSDPANAFMSAAASMTATVRVARHAQAMAPVTSGMSGLLRKSMPLASTMSTASYMSIDIHRIRFFFANMEAAAYMMVDLIAFFYPPDITLAAIDVSDDVFDDERGGLVYTGMEG